MSAPAQTPNTGTAPGPRPGLRVADARRRDAGKPVPTDGKDGERGASDAPAALPVALVPRLSLWQMCLTDDEGLAREVRRQAYRQGATALEIARAWRIRDERIEGLVQVFVDYGDPH